MTPLLSEIQVKELTRLRQAAPEVRCTVIGAIAISHHILLPRPTGDVDLVVAVERPG